MIAIVGRLHPDVMPHRFDGVELRTVRRQQTKVETMSVRREPFPHLGRFVVRRIVMDEEDFLLAVSLGYGCQEHRITLALENLAVPIVESGPVEIDGPKDLLGIALASRRNQRLVSAPGPSLVQGRVLAEAGLVAEEQRRFAFSGFFLAWGRCSAATGPAPPDRLWPIGGADAAPRNPTA